MIPIDEEEDGRDCYGGARLRPYVAGHIQHEAILEKTRRVVWYENVFQSVELRLG